MSRENNFLEREDAITRETIAEYEKITDRRTQIARLLRRKNLALWLWLGATLLLFEYVWFFRYPEATIATAFMYAMFPATLGGFHYFNERRIANPQIQRLMKYELLFDSFFEAMIRDMERNDDEKGNTWRTMDLEELRKFQNRKWGDLQAPGARDDIGFYQRHQAKLANYSAMIYLRMMDDSIEGGFEVNVKYDRPGRS